MNFFRRTAALICFATGYHTVEVLDLSTGKMLASLTGFGKPTGWPGSRPADALSGGR